MNKKAEYKIYQYRFFLILLSCCLFFTCEAYSADGRSASVTQLNNEHDSDFILQLKTASQKLGKEILIYEDISPGVLPKKSASMLLIMNWGTCLVL